MAWPAAAAAFKARGVSSPGGWRIRTSRGRRRTFEVCFPSDLNGESVAAVFEEGLCKSVALWNSPCSFQVHILSVIKTHS